jgi:F0F1-type ATP synthase alpha subunit
MLSEISYLEALEKIQGRSQWHLKLYRNVEVLHQQVVENSAAVQQLMADIRDKGQDILEAIRTEREISDATDGKLKAFMDDFVSTFA